MKDLNARGDGNVCVSIEPLYIFIFYFISLAMKTLNEFLERNSAMVMDKESKLK